MGKTFKDYLNEFDNKYSNIEKFDNDFYQIELGVKSFISKANAKDTKGGYSEEYIRARFIYAMVNSGKYQKEYICVEFSFPKGNTKTALKPDVAIFKDKSWIEEFEKAKASKDYKWFRKNTLAIFETKKDNKSVESAVENQLRSAMAENESEDRIFGVYFDNEDSILIFKKIGNSEIRRFNENKELHLNGINGLGFNDRDVCIRITITKGYY
ncbi:MAG: hypothetical protein Q9M97_06375 [Candidatus Gracilibacteria bacterium]|nr:hypothetical protein [Candidatus Gracilibacteria bacterium]